MGNYIKHVKPSKHSRYKQNIIDPRKCHKYFENFKHEPIIQRSALEMQFMFYCENNSSVKRWASECIEIPYFSRLDNKMRTYNPDFLVEMNDGTLLVVEVKPDAQSSNPGPYASTYDKKNWILNSDKWKAAIEWTNKRGAKFIVVGERFLEKYALGLNGI